MAPLTTAEAAERLGISHVRMRALVSAGEVPLLRSGPINLIDPEVLSRFAHTRPTTRGRPLQPETSWQEARELHPLDSPDPDRARRRLRPRAVFHRHRYDGRRYDDLTNDSRLVLSSRPAARNAGVDGFNVVPGDPRAPTVAYLRNADLDVVRKEHALRATDERATLVLAAVSAPWPFAPGQRFAELGIAWLDLEDERDRAADIVAQYWRQNR